MEKIIVMMYTLAAFINMVSFLPQIYTLLRDRTNSASISLQTQGMWMYTVLAGVLYAVFVMNDPVLIFATSVTFIGCSSVTLLTAFNRVKARFFQMEDKSILDVLAKTRFGYAVKAFKDQLVMMAMQPETARRQGRAWVAVTVLVTVTTFFPSL